jgi:hypothetical protein
MTPAQQSQIADLHEQGVSNREIARIVGLSHVSVGKALNAKVETPVVTPAAVVTPSGNPCLHPKARRVNAIRGKRCLDCGERLLYAAAIPKTSVQG